MNESEVKVFDFKGNKLRTTQINGTPYFLGKDAATILQYSRSDNAIRNHVGETQKLMHQISASGQKRNMIFINEAGLYKLIFSSKMPQAENFTNWVAEEVLPTIRKHGAYLTDSAIEQTLTDPDYLIKLATQLKTERSGRLLAEEQVNELKPKATYYDQVLANPSLMNVTAIAKDYGYSGRTFNKLLHELKIQYPQSGTWFLYSKYQDKGWTHSKTVPYTNHKSATGTGSAIQTKWTQKGRLGLYKLLKQHEIYPMIEKLTGE